MEEKAEEMRSEKDSTTTAVFEDEGAHKPKSVSWPLKLTPTLGQ